MSKFQHYWKELQRRHVVKAGLAYLVFSWLIIQVVTILLPLFKIPDSISQIVVIVLAIGFPIWLILAWVYDFSWGSIQKTEDVVFDAKVSEKKNLQLNRVIIGGLTIAVILLVVNTLRLSGDVDELREDVLASSFKSSIAVLALEDRSPNKEQEHLSFGISENIYDRLIKFKDLKVTSPTSSFYYKDKDISFDVIAKELDVAYILEGSIMPLGENYRISIRLIDSKDNTAIWNKTYDDKKENILITYDDLAENIARYLKLTVDEKEVQNKKVDPEAYELYLRARVLDDRGGDDRSEVERKIDSLLRRALKIDSTYAPIHALYAGTLFRQAVYMKMIDRDDGLKRAMRSAKKAYSLDPKNDYALVWCSNVSWHLKDMEAYQRYLDELESLEGSMGYREWCFRRTNSVDEGYPYAKKAVELNPRDVFSLENLIAYETYYGNFDEVLRLTERIGELYPESYTYSNNLFEYYRLTQNYSAAKDLIQDFDEDDQRLSEIWLEGAKGNLGNFEANLESFRSIVDDEGWYNYYVACIYAINGRKDDAFHYLDEAFEAFVDVPEFLFIDTDLKSLHDDPRWDKILDRLGAYFKYDFKHKS